MASTIELTRQEKGQAIAQLDGQVSRVTAYYYTVRSQSNTRQNYFVELSEKGWSCSCPDHEYRNAKCKHIWAVEISNALRRKVSELAIISPINVQACPGCGNAERIVKHGIRKNKYGNIQLFLCRNCGKKFTVNLGFEKMHASPQVITSAMQLYFSGESLRNTQKFLKLQGVNISHVGILGWIKKYISLMQNYVEKITPAVSETWRADELYVKIKGNMKYLFALMDDETRFWIAQEVADTKERHDARRLFSMAKERAGKVPDTIITDGLDSYHLAYKKEFRRTRTGTTRHISEIALAGKIHNNKMERMNGEIRDREKTMRGLKIKETPILKGYQLFHNFIRPHEALEGKTPADKAGIEVLGENKWRTLIENASQSEKAS
jgi:transposase-like protein